MTAVGFCYRGMATVTSESCCCLETGGVGESDHCPVLKKRQKYFFFITNHVYHYCSKGNNSSLIQTKLVKFGDRRGGGTRPLSNGLVLKKTKKKNSFHYKPCLLLLFNLRAITLA